jgi:hypothetical protein
MRYIDIAAAFGGVSFVLSLLDLERAAMLCAAVLALAIIASALKGVHSRNGA